MGQNGNRFLMPNQVDVGFQGVDCPMASPIAVVLNTPHGPQAIAFGGLTKLQHIATHLMAHYTQNHHSIEDAASMAVHAAEVLMKECFRRETELQKEAELAAQKAAEDQAENDRQKIII